MNKDDDKIRSFSENLLLKNPNEKKISEIAVNLFMFKFLCVASFATLSCSGYNGHKKNTKQ